MSIQAVLAPLFVQIILTLVLLYGMGGLRGVALRSGTVRPEQMELQTSGWPQRATQFSNCFRNQFELPVLFYGAVIIAWVTRKADLLFVILSWLFVLSRIGHALVHVTFNRVPVRGGVYAIGGFILTVLWGVLIVRVMLGP
ncbi:MAG: MAPEG family protein [Rhizobiales bacterium]|nr:MAPEG family protein [Hyphomicrobiales bacterium]